MIRQYHLTLRSEEAIPFRSDLAYPLYGEIMRSVSQEFGEMAHEQGFTPLSQYIERIDGNSIRWHVTLFGEWAEQEIAPFLESVSSIYLDVRNITLRTEGAPEILQTTPKEILIKASGQTDAFSRREITLISPTTFKSAGEYVLFPSASLVIRSLVASWNAAADEVILDDEDMLRMLTEGIRIVGYRLSSTTYRIKGQHIPAFTGVLRFQSRLAAPLQTIWNALLLFGEYAGVGIKTALGMGGFRIN